MRPESSTNINDPLAQVVGVRIESLPSARVQGPHKPLGIALTMDTYESYILAEDLAVPVGNALLKDESLEPASHLVLATEIVV